MAIWLDWLKKVVKDVLFDTNFLNMLVYRVTIKLRHLSYQVWFWSRISGHSVLLFYILLTVRHVMILGKWPTWRTILFYVFIYIFNSLHVSSTSCSSSVETNCVNTTSGSCRWPCRVQVGSSHPTCTRHDHRHRVTATRGCIDTICLSWWWARCARNM